MIHNHDCKSKATTLDIAKFHEYDRELHYYFFYDYDYRTLESNIHEHALDLRDWGNNEYDQPF